MREVFGMLLGWVILTVVCWFIALSLMMYSLASFNPFSWDTEQRIIHLVLQLVLIAAYATYTRWKQR